MSLFRPSRLPRPTIREISTAIFSPATLQPHHTHHTSHFNPPTHTKKTRSLHTTRPFQKTIISSPKPSRPHPTTTDRGPSSTETTQTDFSVLDVLGNTPVPSTSIDACAWDGFHLNNGAKITGGKGVLLVAGEAFAWSPWLAGSGSGKSLLNGKGQWEVGDESWGVLGLVWPKPDLLILGLGPTMAPLSPATRAHINSLGIRVDIQDTRNASAQFNLLATERGVGSVAAALVPLGFREGVGVKLEESQGLYV